MTKPPRLKRRQLPATTVESEAEQYARDWIAVRLQGDFLELGLAPLHPDAGHAFSRRMFKHYAAIDEKSMMIVLDIAYAGIDDARQALIELILEYGNAHLPAPALLQEFNQRMLTGKMTRPLGGAHKATKVLQDISIAVLIGELVEKFGLQPTRNKWTKGQSAADIVAAAMRKAGVRGVTEAGAAKVWTRYERIVRLMNPKS